MSVSKLKNKMRVLPLCGLLFGLGLFVSGCEGQAFRSNPQLVASPDKVSMMLADAADRASVALETLAAIEQSRSPAIAVAPIENAPPHLMRAVTVNWVGPAEPITRQMANRAGYRFQPIGTAPPVPSIISIDVENTSIIDVLRSIGLQLGVRADIRVDSRNKVVEIHYVGNTGVGG
jgi:defect-in-organelle-trafficking protein DotD